MEETKTNFNWKRLLITLTLVLLTAGAVGGGVYYVLDSNFKKERSDNDKALNSLQDEVKKLKAEDKTTATTAAAKDETADWKTYANEAFGISFKYPSSLVIKENPNPIVGKENAGVLRMEDSTGYPKFQLVFNPLGIGGCMLDEDDYWFKSVSIAGNKVKYSDKVMGSAECEGAAGVTTASITIGKGITSGKNSIWVTYSDKTLNGDAQLVKILNSISISKSNIYY